MQHKLFLFFSFLVTSIIFSQEKKLIHHTILKQSPLFKADKTPFLFLDLVIHFNFNLMIYMEQKTIITTPLRIVITTEKITIIKNEYLEVSMTNEL